MPRRRAAALPRINCLFLNQQTFSKKKPLLAKILSKNISKIWKIWIKMGNHMHLKLHILLCVLSFSCITWWRFLRFNKYTIGTVPTVYSMGSGTVWHWQPTNFFAPKFGLFRFYAYICTVKSKDLYMSKETMIQQIAHYFETQPVLKAWIIPKYLS